MAPSTTQVFYYKEQGYRKQEMNIILLISLLYCRIAQSHFTYYLLCFYVPLDFIDVGMEGIMNHRLII